MFKCDICGSDKFENKKVDKVYTIDGELLVVNNIPANVCINCGEENFDIKTLSHVQSIIYGKPKRIIQAKSFEYA
jgi:YgiT-type zinc finger domain-containing protein